MRGRPPLVVHACVLAYAKPKETLIAIHSLRSSSWEPAIIHIIFNGADRDVQDQIMAGVASFDGIHVHTNKENLGFAGGMNVGMRAALEMGATHVFLLNDDATVSKTCLEQLLDAAGASPRVGLVGPTIYYADERDLVWQGGGRFSAWRTWVSVPTKNRKLAPNEFLPPHQLCSFLTGCAMLISADAVRAVGMLDSTIFFYSEDVDYCLRIAAKRFEIVYVPSASCWHDTWRARRGHVTRFTMYHLARSRIHVLKRNFPRPYLVYALLVHLGAFTPWRGLQALRGPHPLAAMKAWIAGTLDGLRGGPA